MQLNWLNVQLQKIWPFVDEVLYISFFVYQVWNIYGSRHFLTKQYCHVKMYVGSVRIDKKQC